MPRSLSSKLCLSLKTMKLTQRFLPQLLKRSKSKKYMVIGIKQSGIKCPYFYFFRSQGKNPKRKLLVRYLKETLKLKDLYLSFKKLLCFCLLPFRKLHYKSALTYALSFYGSKMILEHPNHFLLSTNRLGQVQLSHFGLVGSKTF